MSDGTSIFCGYFLSPDIRRMILNSTMGTPSSTRVGTDAVRIELEIFGLELFFLGEVNAHLVKLQCLTFWLHVE